MIPLDIDLGQKRLNPIVDRYVTTDLPLLAILQTTPDPRNPLIRSLSCIQECLDGKRLPKEALEAAKSAPIRRSDPELLILMLTSWAELSCRVGRISEAQALLERAKVLISDHTHPEIRAHAMLAESVLADTTGRKTDREQMLKAIIELLPAYSPRCKFYIWEFALFLALQGRGVECQSEIRELSWQCNEQFKMIRVHMVQFIDAVETGRLREAALLLPQVSHDLHQVKKLARIPWRYQALLRLMQECANEKESPLSRPERLQRPPAWLEVLYCLVSKDTDKALRLARAEAGRQFNSIFSSGFDSFNLIRAELAAGKWEGARHLLKMRQERGNEHYLDDFFFARVELLAENKKAASRHFAETLKSVEHYRANGRLDFELRLACDLSQGDIVQLTQSAVKLTQPARPGAGGAVPARPQGAGGADTALGESDRHGVNLIIGRSAAITEIRQAIIRFADLDAPVLISGETGTGKDLVAEALHQASKQRSHPFIPVNCGSITETLLESELFGHERGAFTGAERTTKGLFDEAGSGTIFLDEIGSISPRLQSALLRVLETGEIRAVGSARTRTIHCRVIAATNADLKKLADEHRFRQDLLFRLQRLGIYIPPLRERKDDILPLCRHFLDIGRPIGTHATLAKDLGEALKSYEWPGNVRELKNVIERMRLMNSDKLSYALDDLDLKFNAIGVPEEEEERETTDKHRAIKKHPAGKPVEQERKPDRSAGEQEKAGTTAGETPAAAPAITPVEPALGGETESESMPEGSIDHVLREGRSSIRRLDRLRKLFTEYRKLTRSEAVEILNVSPNTATKDLKTLCTEGFIERVEPSASTRSHYFVLKQQAEKKQQN